MAINIRDKIEAFFGILYSCEKCGSIFSGKENANKHEKNCKE